MRLGSLSHGHGVIIVKKARLFLYFQDLENYLKDHTETKIKRIEEIGSHLRADCIMPDSVQSDVKTLMERWDLLRSQVCLKDRQ